MALIQDSTGVYTWAINSSGQGPVTCIQFPTAAAAADSLTNPTISQVGADTMLFNGATWDRKRCNQVVTPDASAARTTTVAGASFVNYNFGGATITINATVVSGTTPTLVAKLQYSIDGGTTWFDYNSKTTTATISTVSTTTMIIYPGVIEVANSAISLPLPRICRMYYTIGGTTPSFTFATYVNWMI